MRTICYYPELVQMTGSINAALMMAQLEFWFKVMAGKPFYKFLEPCNHELYKVGDSWSEELGMTGSEIRSAFKRIGVMYKSKSAFLQSEDVFQGKPYAAYYDRIRKTTYYFRNDAKVQEMMPKELFSECTSKSTSKRDAFTQKDGTTKRYDSAQQASISKEEGFSKKTSITKSEGSVQQDIQSGKKEMATYTHSFSVTQETQDGLYRDDYRINNIEESIQENRSKTLQVCKKDTLVNQHASHLSIPFEEMMSLYNDKLGEKLGHVEQLTPLDKNRIKKLWYQYSIRLEDFEKAFMKVAASKFLCGEVEGKKWRASFKWLLAEDHLIKVLEGIYDDFLAPPTFLHTCPDKIKYFNQMESHHFDFDEIEKLEKLYIDHKLSELSSECH